MAIVIRPGRARLGAAVLAAVAAAGGLTAGAAHARAATPACAEQTAPVAGGVYTVQNNEWDSSAPECVTTDGNADFTVANSSISNATNGAPGRLPVHLPGLPLGQLHLGRPDGDPGPGLGPDHGQGDHELVHHAARRQQRLRRRLRHLVQPDTDHLRPAQRHRADGLAEPQRPGPAVRLRRSPAASPSAATPTTSGKAPSRAGTPSPTT